MENELFRTVLPHSSNINILRGCYHTKGKMCLSSGDIENRHTRHLSFFLPRLFIHLRWRSTFLKTFVQVLTCWYRITAASCFQSEPARSKSAPWLLCKQKHDWIFALFFTDHNCLHFFEASYLYFFDETFTSEISLWNWQTHLHKLNNMVFFPPCFTKPVFSL